MSDAGTRLMMAEVDGELRIDKNCPTCGNPSLVRKSFGVFCMRISCDYRDTIFMFLNKRLRKRQKANDKTN